MAPGSGWKHLVPLTDGLFETEVNMASLILVFLIFLLAIAGLGVGVLLGRAPLQGSCGGISCAACNSCPRRKTGGKADD